VRSIPDVERSLLGVSAPEGTAAGVPTIVLGPGVAATAAASPTPTASTPTTASTGSTPTASAAASRGTLAAAAAGATATAASTAGSTTGAAPRWGGATTPAPAWARPPSAECAIGGSPHVGNLYAQLRQCEDKNRGDHRGEDAVLNQILAFSRSPQ
jgi:hypothetical protein